MKAVSIHEKLTLSFPAFRFTPESIIAFASKYDPLPFHLSHEEAQKSIFKKLVASGPHPFHQFYVYHWLPVFSHTVMAGLSLNNWRFLLPVYAGDYIHCTVSVVRIVPFKEKNSAAVTWGFIFINQQNELVQQLEMEVLHKI